MEATQARMIAERISKAVMLARDQKDIPTERTKFASVQVDFPSDAAAAILAFAGQIPPEELHEDGIEERPHITVKYGIHNDDPMPIIELLRGQPPISAKMGKLDFFDAEEYDVLIITVESADLMVLNKYISNSVEVTDTHPTYTPHATLAYLKKGLGEGYKGNDTFDGLRAEFESMNFSPSDDGEDTCIMLGDDNFPVIPRTAGGPGSGNFGHGGRRGEVGGSSTHDAMTAIEDEILAKRSADADKPHSNPNIGSIIGQIGSSGEVEAIDFKDPKGATNSEHVETFKNMTHPQARWRYYGKGVTSTWPKDHDAYEEIEGGQVFWLGEPSRDDYHKVDNYLAKRNIKPYSHMISSGRGRVDPARLKAAGGPGSGNFGHGGRPGEVGGSSSSMSDKASANGYTWEKKTTGIAKGKYAWFKEGEQVSAPHKEHEADKAAGTMHYGKGPKEKAPDAPAKASVAPTSESSSAIQDIVGGTKTGPQKGTNPGGLYEAKDGSKWYVKSYKDPQQAHGEHLANSIYHDLGVGAPHSVVGEIDGKTYYASNFMSGKGTLQEMGLNKENSEKILDGFAADAFLGNWDAVGTGLDNVMIHHDDSVSRIDNGGSFLHRAQGSLKSESLLQSVGEWKSLVDPTTAPYYSRVFKKAGIKDGDALGNRAVQQIDKILDVRTKAGGWHKYLDQKIPNAPKAYREKVASALESRSAHLEKIRQRIGGSKIKAAAANDDRPAPVMKKRAIESALADLNGWVLLDGMSAIGNTYNFPDRRQSAAFVAQLLEDCNQRNHHPDVVVDGQDVSLKYTTHAVDDRLTRLDFECAAYADKTAPDYMEATEAPRAAGGAGSGNFGHAGRPGEIGGSGGSGESNEARLSTIHDAVRKHDLDKGVVRFDRGPGYAMANGQRHAVLRELGHQQSDIETMDQLYWLHADQPNTQEPADAEIDRHLTENTSVAAVMRDQALINELAYKDWKAAASTHAENKRASEQKDWNDGWLDDRKSERGGAYENFDDYFKTEHWDSQRILDGEPVELTLYRRGKEEKPVMAWTTNSAGADTQPLSGGVRIVPNRKETVDSLLKKGHLILGGFVGIMGRSGESEVTLYKPTKLPRAAGGQGSGNFGHHGRPGEVGGSSSDSGGRSGDVPQVQFPIPAGSKYTKEHIAAAYAMKQKGMSQKQMAEKTGISWPTLYHAFKKLDTSKEAIAEKLSDPNAPPTPVSPNADKPGVVKQEPYTQEDLQKAWELKKAGASIKEIHEKTGITGPTQYHGFNKIKQKEKEEQEKATKAIELAFGNPESVPKTPIKSDEDENHADPDWMNPPTPTSKAPKSDEDENHANPNWMNPPPPKPKGDWDDGPPADDPIWMNSPPASTVSMADKASKNGYTWEQKTTGIAKGKYAWFKDGVQVSAPHEKDASEKAAETMHFGTGPKESIAPDAAPEPPVPPPSAAPEPPEPPVAAPKKLSKDDTAAAVIGNLNPKGTTKEALSQAWKMKQDGYSKQAIESATGVTAPTQYHTFKKIEDAHEKAVNKAAGISEELKKPSAFSPSIVPSKADVTTPVEPHHPSTTASLTTQAKDFGYSWQEKTYGPAKGKYAWFKDGVQVSAPHLQSETEKAAGTMHFGTGPQAPAKDDPAQNWPVATSVDRKLGQYYPNVVEKHSTSWRNALPPDQKSSIKSYISGSDSINAQLRKGTMSETSKNIQNALSKAPPPPPPTLVWRGVDKDVAAKIFDKLSTGDEFKLDGFQSTSIDPTFAAKWKGGSGKCARCLLEIIPKSGGYVKPLAGSLEHEYEFIIPHGKSYRVRGITKVNIPGHGPRSVLQLEML